MPANPGGGLAAWSIRHPVGVVMIALAVVLLGFFALARLGIDLLPDLIYPEVRVRILDPGVPATIMEDQVTRQLEEQLAVTEDAIQVQSRTTEGRSSVDLSFAYGKDIDIALRDASSRLDRAKRFLPETIEPAVIYKRDPSQRPVAEFVVSSSLRDPVAIRSYADYVLAPWLLNLPGVAAAEIGGGLVREIQVIADQQRLAGLGLDVMDVTEALQRDNIDVPGGRLLMSGGEISGRISGRFRDLDEIRALPLAMDTKTAQTRVIHLGEVAEVIDGAEDERLHIRFNGLPGIKLSIQKQPQANTVEVADTVFERLDWLRAEGLIPEDIHVEWVDDQASYVRNALRNAALAATSGALLAMLVVYLFLGSLRRTLIIGSAIPIAILVTFSLMSLGGLTLNIMTLGGLALGVGMLVDSTIVMLENIHRHQRHGEDAREAPTRAASEVNSAIVASTTTNLAAVLPFLFIGGLAGLLFRELIFTISAAIAASLVVALTLVPALAGRVPAGNDGLLRRGVARVIDVLRNAYGALIARLLRVPWLVVALFALGLAVAVPVFQEGKQIFLPQLDEGRVYVSLTADTGISIEQMDGVARRIESLLSDQPEVDSLFTTVGGFVFGRSQFESANRTSINLRLKPLAERGGIGSGDWIKRVRKLIAAEQLAGVKIFMRVQGIRGLRLSQGDDDISLRLQGPELDMLEQLAHRVVGRVRGIEGLRNVEHSAEEERQEVSVVVDRERARRVGLAVEDVGEVLQIALEGVAVTDFIDGDRSYDVRLRLARRDVADPQDLESVILYSKTEPRTPIRLGEIARVEIIAAPASILRDRQQRIVEVTASLAPDLPLGEALDRIDAALEDLAVPKGYTLYEGGSEKLLREGQNLGRMLLGLALFLVFVVMAVQYESLRNPLVIMLSVPFALIGVALAIHLAALPLSMPVWLGLIMLAGIVVNNAIVLVEYIEIERGRGLALSEAIVQAARLRLRPILMTTLTTVVGMSPLALAWGEGAEMLQPLAITIVSGLSFSMLVSLVLVPVVYQLVGRRS